LTSQRSSREERVARNVAANSEERHTNVAGSVNKKSTASWATASYTVEAFKGTSSKERPGSSLLR